VTATPTPTRTRPRRSAWLREVVVIDLILMVVLGFLWFEALALGPASRRFPVWVIAITGLLVVGDLVRELVPRFAPRQVEGSVDAPGDLDDAGSDGGATSGEVLRPDPGLNQWAVLASVVVLTGLMVVFSYVIVVPVFLLGFFWWVKAPWRVAIPTTFVLWLFAWGFFNQVLGLR